MHACDTNAFIWFITGDTRRLSRDARRVLDRAAAGRGVIHLSVASLQEIADLGRRGRLGPAWIWDRWLDAARGMRGLVIEPITLDDVDQARAFGEIPDPFDRLIAGMACRLDLPLITADERLRKSPHVKVAW